LTWKIIKFEFSERISSKNVDNNILNAEEQSLLLASLFTEYLIKFLAKIFNGQS